MRKNFSDIGFFPQPVLVIGTFDEAGVPNAMNVGWGGMCGSRYVNITISRRHKTTDNIFSKKAFTMSFADRAHLVEADYFGLISGAEENKIEKAGFHALRSEFVDAPLFEELPLTLECRVLNTQVQDISQLPEAITARYYPAAGEGPDLHTLYYGEIVNAYLITED